MITFAIDGKVIMVSPVTMEINGITSNVPIPNIGQKIGLPGLGVDRYKVVDVCYKYVTEKTDPSKITDVNIFIYLHRENPFFV